MKFSVMLGPLVVPPLSSNLQYPNTSWMNPLYFDYLTRFSPEPTANMSKISSTTLQVVVLHFLLTSTGVHLNLLQDEDSNLLPPSSSPQNFHFSFSALSPTRKMVFILYGHRLGVVSFAVQYCWCFGCTVL